MRPIVGIATSVAHSEGTTRQVLDLRYAQALERAGAAPLLLPLGCGEEAVMRTMEIVSGLVLTGGNGVTDGLVGTLPDDLAPEREERRQAEVSMYSAARDRGLPVLGICYGMQFINARCGGTILADAMAQAGAGPHSPSRNGQQPVSHPVEVVADTWIGGLVAAAGGDGTRALVNSSHFQAVSRVGEGLRVAARSPDGLIEAIENPEGDLLGVQWHPERMPGSVWDGLFDHFVSRARTTV